MIYKDDVYKLCVQKGYFTRGTNEQYYKMFNMLNVFSMKDVAVVIWLCSDNRFSFDSIYTEIKKLNR